MPASVKHKIYQLLDPSEGATKSDRLINAVIIGLIVLNAFAAILETVDALYNYWYNLFNAIEEVSVVLFTVEYLLRIWTCTENDKYKDGLSGRLRYMLSFGSLVDLFSFLPFYIPFLVHVDLRFLRMFRLLRFFRFLKLGRYLKASAMIRRVFQAKKEELALAFIITFFLIIIASCVMYYIEHDTQPDKFSSIPETMWWSVATLTTVGYGDVYPITILGKTLTAFISILGIGMFALPAGILASGFSSELSSHKKVSRTCPHCNKEIT